MMHVCENAPNFPITPVCCTKEKWGKTKLQVLNLDGNGLLHGSVESKN